MWPNIKKNRTPILLITAVACVAIYYFKFIYSSPEKEAPIVQVKTHEIKPLTFINEKKNRSTTDFSDAVPTLKEYDDEWCLSTELTQEARDLADSEYDAWIISRNHVVGDRANQVARFKYYDESVLKALGEQGNFIALSAIVDSDTSSEEMKIWAALKAGVYGGTGDAVSYFSTEKKGQSKALMRSGKTEEAKKLFLESVAWDEFLALRGDISIIENIAFILSSEEMKDLKITPEDEKWISLRAKKIYTSLSKERESLGLAPFDNSVPKAIEVDNAKFIAFTMKQYDLSNTWLAKYYPNSDCTEKILTRVKN